MAHEDDVPTFDQRRPPSPRRPLRRLSAPSPVDVSASLEEFIGTCAQIEEALEAEPEPEPVPDPDPPAPQPVIMPRPFVMPEPIAARARLGLNAASLAFGAVLALGVLLVGFGRTQGDRPVSAAPAPASPAALPRPAAVPPVVVPAPPVVVAAPVEIAKPAAPKRAVVRRKPAVAGSKTSGIVDPFAE